jgi:O-antigen ligase
MLKSLLNPRFGLFWLLLHAFLGVLTAYFTYIIIFWFYIILLFLLRDLFGSNSETKKGNLLLIISYLVSFEIICRMAKTSPYIPYELSKYLLFSLLIYGISLRRLHFHVGWFLIILLLPSMFFDLSGSVNNYEYYVFNILGPINAALGIILCSKLLISFQTLRNILFLLICPVVSVLFFAYTRTPDYDEIQFNLGANFVTSGGFGSNQVSTVLGLGMFLVFLFLFFKWNLSGFKMLDLILFFGFVFQGLITFSRGGILSGFFSILICSLIILFNFNNKRIKSSNYLNINHILILLFLVSTFFIANNLTNGNLLLRYKGETEGTMSGTKEQTLNNMTSNRFDIFIGDLKLWKSHPILGVGIGASQLLRDEVSGVVAHVELSRLLAEHGILGFIYFFLLIYFPFKYMRKENNVLVKALKYSIFMLAIFTTFHASMRTYVTPLLIAISLVTVSSKSINNNSSAIDNIV